MKKYILSTFIIGFLFVSLSAQAQTQTNSTPLDPTPRVMFLAGAVNQHVDSLGNWLTDDDRISGAHVDARGTFGVLVAAGTPSNLTDANRLAYCKKFYPNTVSIEKYKIEQSTAWMSRYNRTGPTTNSAQSYKCVQAAISTEKTVVDGGWSEWQNYYACSNGRQAQTRTCTNPKPANGGKTCSGVSSQYVSCSNTPLSNLTAILSEVQSLYVKGTLVNFAGVIKNEGVEVNKQFTNSFNLYSSTTLIFSQSTVTPKIGANNVLVTSKDITLPTKAGLYMLELCVDSKKVITETDEKDNCASRTINVVDSDPSKLPDLKVSSLLRTPVGSLSKNSTVSFHPYAYNAGTAAVPKKTFYDHFQVSSTSSLSGWIADFSQTKETNNQVKPGSSYTVNPGKYKFTKDGIYYVRACVDLKSKDAKGDIAESNEDNNCSDWIKVQIGVDPSTLPNLTAAFDNTTYVPGVKGNINATVTKTGTTTKGVVFYNRMDISTKSNLIQAWYSDFKSYKLTANTSNFSLDTMKVSFPWEFKEGYTGVRFCTDQGNYNNNNGLNKENQIRETNELDNCTEWVKFTAIGGTSSTSLPDFIVDGHIYTDNLYSVVKGENFPLYATIKNNGASTETTFKNHFEYKSSWLGEITSENPIIVNGLAQGEQKEIKTYKKFDKAGTYYVRVCADQKSRADDEKVNDVKEISEKNNCFKDNTADWTYIVVRDNYTDPINTTNGAYYSPLHGKDNKQVINLAAHLSDFSNSFISSDSISYPAYIYNEGSAVTTDFKTTFTVKDSSGKIISNYSNLPFTPTVPANSKTALIAYKFKTPPSGNYTVDFCVDTTDLVVETKNSDNCTSKKFVISTTTSKSTDGGNTTGQSNLKSCQAFQFTRNMSYGSNDYVRLVPAEVSKLKELLIFLKAKYPADRYLSLIALKDTDGSFGKETQQAVDYLQSFDGSEYGMTDSRVRSFDQQTGNTGPLTRAKLNYLWDNVKCVAESQVTSTSSTNSASSDSTGGGTQNSNSSGGKGATVDYSAPDTAQQ